jgi:hypothetical protein
MTRWSSPYGSGRCLLCPADAVVVVLDPDGDEAELCGQHWRIVRELTNGLVRAVRFIHRRRGSG